MLNPFGGQSFGTFETFDPYADYYAVTAAALYITCDDDIPINP